MFYSIIIRVVRAAAVVASLKSTVRRCAQSETCAPESFMPGNGWTSDVRIGLGRASFDRRVHEFVLRK